MDQIITFDKSLQTRLQEYEEAFSDIEALPYSKIQAEWSYYLKLALDPSGWQALWKIPRTKCEELKIPYPTAAIVFVLGVEYPKHVAFVRIIDVQGDLHLRNNHHVPLVELWPTKKQDKSIALNLNSTANALDMLRFFYRHMLMPWDEDEDSLDWRGSHLVSRLRFYYDLRNGKIPDDMSDHIFALLNEARRLNSKRQKFIRICEEIDSDVEDSNDKNIEALMEINVRLIEIHQEVDMFENETFRKALLKRQKVPCTKNENKEHIWIICKKASPKEYAELLNHVEKLYADKPLSFSHGNLMAKLESANNNDKILLAPDLYKIKYEGVVISNNTIKGITDTDRNTIQVLSLADDVMFDCIGDNDCRIENIFFDCKNTQNAILVRRGHVTLKSCRLVGDNSSTTHQGILVLKGARLSIDSCDISGFSVGIVGNTGSVIDIKDSVIHSGSSGIKVYENCQLGIYNSVIKECKEFGVVIETDCDFPDLEIRGRLVEDSFSVLDRIPFITTESLKGNNNVKGCVVVEKFNLSAKDNLFENPNLDYTVIENSDVDMECSDDASTVLQVS